MVVIKVEQVAGLEPKHVREFWRTQKLLTLSGVRSPDHQVYSVVAIPTTLSLAREIRSRKEGGKLMIIKAINETKTERKAQNRKT